MSADQKSYLITSKIGISFPAEQAQNAAELYKGLVERGMKPDEDISIQRQMTDSSVFLTIYPGYGAGLPVAASFISKVFAEGGHFSGNSMASFFNSLGRQSVKAHGEAHNSPRTAAAGGGRGGRGPSFTP
ncbi:MAG: hypothetical protein HYU57_00080 [Micavibrio aeruginosavorus]|nr:hypothetical protein [Micavibrio aeruginosavorus]